MLSSAGLGFALKAEELRDLLPRGPGVGRRHQQRGQDDRRDRDHRRPRVTARFVGRHRIATRQQSKYRGIGA
jgi:hypothetical protein